MFFAVYTDFYAKKLVLSDWFLILSFNAQNYKFLMIKARD
ncbi:hypothetical protein CCAND38_240051 [Capnocytophaga canis]|uniref:Uncharacterized protein n=1 Tax=Capnocytophaga canis TaxID=1848903 RepID=A0A0B7I6D3_9FLAO|nr:hypothetical protein CCAND38_240051 [Capnocytophaga canis]CEN52558.1 hypothetical protein CCAND93_260016 [Capnocytophaga canis]